MSYFWMVINILHIYAYDPPLNLMVLVIIIYWNRIPTLARNNILNRKFLSLDWFTLRCCSNSFVSSILIHYWPTCNSISHLALVQLTLKVVLFISFVSMNVHYILNADYMLILPTTVNLKFSSYDLLWWNDIIEEAVKNKTKPNKPPNI